jgi:hypothetical protein
VHEQLNNDIFFSRNIRIVLVLVLHKLKLNSNLLFSVEYLRALPMSSLLDRLVGADGVALFRLFRVSFTLLVRGVADVGADTVTPAVEGFEVEELTVEFEPEIEKLRLSLRFLF